MFTFPDGFLIQVDRPVRVFTGPGANTDTELFWGLGGGVWANTQDCARLGYPGGGAYRLATVPGACP